MNVETILRNKGNRVATIRPDALIEEAVDRLRQMGIGALIVSVDGETVDGIVSERDVVIALADVGANLLSRSVSEIMTATVVTCEPSDTCRRVDGRDDHPAHPPFPGGAGRPIVRHRQYRRSGQEPARRDRIRGEFPALVHRRECVIRADRAFND